MTIYVGAWWFSLQIFRSTVGRLDFLERSYLDWLWFKKNHFETGDFWFWFKLTFWLCDFDLKSLLPLMFPNSWVCTNVCICNEDICERNSLMSYSCICFLCVFRSFYVFYCHFLQPLFVILCFNCEFINKSCLLVQILYDVRRYDWCGKWSQHSFNNNSNNVLRKLRKSYIIV